ncbi:sensor histidine kinase [Streptomyces sp. x-19]|uniref:sensor histidine kinase n=1 Tax=Streptomyces sp. x-19 TaxID=2789280 RepID=UPI003980C4D8
MLTSVLLTGIACVIVGSVTAIFMCQNFYTQLDDQLRGIAMRASGHRISNFPPLDPPKDPLGFIRGPGQPPGTLGVLLEGNAPAEGRVTVSNPFSRQISEKHLSRADLAQFGAMSEKLAYDFHTIDTKSYGSYRVQEVTLPNGAHAIVGLSTANLDEALVHLIIAECVVTVSSLAAVALVAAVITSRSLSSLQGVIAIATQVARLDLHRGDVLLRERVREADTDRCVETGQVAAALNRLIDHVASALEARHANEVKIRQFVADASHELRTPLASIRGYAELTRRGGEAMGKDTRYALTRIESESVRMTGLVEDLLLLARLDAGRPLANEDIDISRVVLNSVNDARAASPSHSWKLQMGTSPIMLRGDEARLQQVLTNLLSNARVHTPSSTTVTTRAAQEGKWAVIEVMDDGPGIDVMIQGKIFDRFTRGDASRSRGKGGSGLGLAIAQTVAEAHGGTITLRSNPGNTVFRVSLPIDSGQDRNRGNPPVVDQRL